MNKFNWYEAKSVEDAIAQSNKTVADEIYQPSGKASIFKSGGVDVWDMVKEGLLAPQTVVNVRNIEGLDRISYSSSDGLQLGANVTLAELEESGDIKENFTALHLAIAHAATPQLRNMSTIAGNIAQRTRCWYFRSSDHPCMRKGGDRCYARSNKSGENENHAILENGSCVSLHASSIATALLAHEASVVIRPAKGEEKVVAIEDFFLGSAEDISRENILEAGDLITAVKIPAPRANVKSYYIKQVARESYDWSLADVAIVAEISGGKCEQINIALGAAAPRPIRAYEAEQVAKGKTINEKTARQIAEAAMAKAKPLSQNGYKVPLFETTIKDVLLEIA